MSLWGRRLGSVVAVLVVATLGWVGSATAATYNPAIGEQSFYQFEDTDLSDRLQLRVNVASGNLLVKVPEIELAGRAGSDLVVAHYYNSLDKSAGHQGRGWSTSLGPDDVRLSEKSDGTIIYHGPTGFDAPFPATTSGYQTEIPE